jgi:hypothetical protein
LRRSRPGASGNEEATFGIFYWITCPIGLRGLRGLHGLIGLRGLTGLRGKAWQEIRTKRILETRADRRIRVR